MQSDQRSRWEGLFRIQPHEVRPTVCAFVYLFNAIGAFTIARTTRTALFLELPNYKEAYPLAIIITALTISATMFVYSRFERTVRRDRLNSATLVLLCAITLAFRVALFESHPAIYWCFYVWTEIFGAFLVIQFWTFINEIFHSRQGKRLFAIIGGGGVLSNIPIGWGIRALVPIIGTENLLFIIIICLLICLLMVQQLGRLSTAKLDWAHEPNPDTSLTAAPTSHRVFNSKHVKLIAAAIVLTYFASTLVNYQFTVILGDSIPGKDERTIFMASLFLVTGVLGALIQFTVTARFLERLGVLPALLMLPLVMFLGTSSLLLLPALVPALWVASFIVGSEKVLKYTINDSTIQLMYLPVPTFNRGRAKAIIDGVLKETSKGAAGLLVFFLFSSREYLGFGLPLTPSVKDLSWLIGGALVLWVFVAMKLRDEYTTSLMDTLEQRRINFNDDRLKISDEATVNRLNRYLCSEDLNQIRNALDILSSISPNLLRPIRENINLLLLHEKEDIRETTLELIKAKPTLYSDAVEQRLNDSAPRVKAAAITTYCSHERDNAVKTVAENLTDPNQQVRAVSIAALVRFGGLDGILASAEHLKDLLTNDHPENRAYAAWILGEVGVQHFYQPLVSLLQDPNETVKLAAVKAAGSLTNPKLIPHLLPLLEQTRLAGAVTRTLTRFGAPVEPLLEDLLKDKSNPQLQRSNGCRVFARLKTPRSAAILTEELTDSSVHVRTAAVNALRSLTQANPSTPLETDAIIQALRAESKEWLKLFGLIDDLQNLDGAYLLRDALSHRQAMSHRLLLNLLSLQYDPSTIDLVARNLGSAHSATRANAIELLDNILEKELKLLLVPLFEAESPEQKRDLASAEFGLEPRRQIHVLMELIQLPGAPWINACSAFAAGKSNLYPLEDLILELLTDPNEICRETAALALTDLELTPERRKQLEPLLLDPAPGIRQYTQQLLNSHPA